MGWVSSEEVVDMLTFLLPGFLAGMIFYSLTFYPKPSAFDRLINALIFTTAGQALTRFIVLLVWNADPTDEIFLALNILIAVGLALVSAYVLNKDIIHRLFRRAGITKETSYPSEWYRAFARHPDCYVILHMDEQRRLYGYPEEWPSDPNKGHFRIVEAEWLDDKTDADANKTDADANSAMLIPATQVKMVEFLNMETVEKPKE